MSKKRRKQDRRRKESIPAWFLFLHIIVWVTIDWGYSFLLLESGAVEFTMVYDIGVKKPTDLLHSILVPIAFIKVFTVGFFGIMWWGMDDSSNDINSFAMIFCLLNAVSSAVVSVFLWGRGDLFIFSASLTYLTAFLWRTYLKQVRRKKN